MKDSLVRRVTYCEAGDFEYPQMGLAPSTAGGPSPPLFPAPRTLPPTPDWAAPSRSIAKRAKGGGEKREGEGGEGRALA